MLLVVTRFFDRLARNRGQFGIARLRQVPPHQLQKGRDHGIAQHRQRKITLTAEPPHHAVRQLHQGWIHVIALFTQKRQLVFIERLAPVQPRDIP